MQPPPRPLLRHLQGIPTVDRAVINRKENDKDKFHILVEGTNLQVLEGVEGVLEGGL